MIKTVTKTVVEQVHCCDVCEQVAAKLDTCMACQREFCHPACTKAHMVAYPGSLANPSFANPGGGTVGTYCLECDARLRAEGTDDLHTLFLKMSDILAKREAWKAVRETEGALKKRLAAAFHARYSIDHKLKATNAEDQPCSSL